MVIHIQSRSGRLIIAGVLLAIPAGLALLVWIMFPTDLGPILINDFRPSIAAAVDSEGCIALAEYELHFYMEQNSPKYKDGTAQGRIVELKNGTEARIIGIVLYDHGRFRPATSASTADLNNKELPQMYWVIPKQGPYRGVRVCVSGAVMHYKHAAL